MTDSVSHTVFRLPGAKRALVYKNGEDQVKPSPRETAVKQLQERDAEVRSHEAAHMNAAGVVSIGSPRYSYQIGPDGKAYAVGGEVTLSTLPARNPHDAQVQAQNLKNAALAADDPSPQDLAAASAADAMASEARHAAAFYKKQESLFQEDAGTTPQHTGLDLYS